MITGEEPLAREATVLYPVDPLVDAPGAEVRIEASDVARAGFTAALRRPA